MDVSDGALEESAFVGEKIEATAKKIHSCSLKNSRKMFRYNDPDTVVPYALLS